LSPFYVTYGKRIPRELYERRHSIWSVLTAASELSYNIVTHHFHHC